LSVRLMLDSAWLNRLKFVLTSSVLTSSVLTSSGEQECVVGVRIPMKICANT
jgi:hypothetical protein